MFPNISSENPLLDPAEGAAPAGDVVLEHGEVGGVGSDPERAAADGERGNPDADGQGSCGRRRRGQVLQLDYRLPPETQTQL